MGGRQSSTPAVAVADQTLAAVALGCEAHSAAAAAASVAELAALASDQGQSEAAAAAAGRMMHANRALGYRVNSFAAAAAAAAK
jgi:hypothetical protein